MPYEPIKPNYPAWLRDFFTEGTLEGAEYALPEIYRGLPAGYLDDPIAYSITPESYYEEWDIEQDLRPASGLVSDYPEYEEMYSILDYMFGREGELEDFESGRYAMGDVLEETQSNVRGGLSTGSRNRELMNKKRMITEGMADLEAKKAFGLHSEETEFAKDIYHQRRGYEEQVLQDWISWLGQQPVAEE
jgi:hypothetical protein